MTYRIRNSITAGHPAVQAAFKARGINDYCNALAPHARTRNVQVFVLTDGRVIPADSRVVSEVAREASQAPSADQAVLAA